MRRFQDFRAGCWRTNMVSRRPSCRAGLLLLGASLGGCASSSPRLGMMVAGTPVTDSRVETRKAKLLGKGAEAADGVFGERLDTLRELQGSRQWLTYSLPDDPVADSRVVVELDRSQIVAVSKTRP